MAVIAGPAFRNQSTAYPSSAGGIAVNRLEVSVPANVATTDIMEIGSIPQHCRVVDAIFDTSGSLGAAGAVVDIGMMSGLPGAALNPDNSPRTCGAEFFTGLAVSAAAPGAVTRMTNAPGFRVATTATERSIGLKFTTRGTPTAGVIALTLFIAAT